MGIEDWLGGLSGKAVKDLKKRKSRLEQMEEDAMKSPEQKAEEAFVKGEEEILKKKKKK